MRAELHLDNREGTWVITRSDLEGEVVLGKDSRVRDLFEYEFQRIAEDAAANRPVSRALAGVEVTVDVGPGDLGDGADRSSVDPGPDDSRRRSDARERRALEGELVGRIRTQARRRHAPSPSGRDYGGTQPNETERTIE